MKKFISIILSLLLLIAAAVIPASAEVQNLFSGHIAASRGIYMMCSDGSVGLTDKINNTMLAAVVDGNVSAHNDIQEGLTWEDPRYFGFEFTLDSLFSVEKVRIYAGFVAYPESYTVYASDKLSDLYSQESLVAENILCSGGVAEVAVNRSVKYISFICTELIGNQRVREFEAIGIPTESGEDDPTIHSGFSVKGNRLVDANGNSVRLKGVNITELSWSTFGDGSTESGKSNTDDSVKKAVDEWGCGIIRLAVNADFYLKGGTHKGVTKTAEEYRALVDKFVNYATENGVAVLFDCHAYYGVTDDVIAFWEVAAPKYDGNELVLFGLLNEPVSDWKTYFEGGALNTQIGTITVYGIAALLDTVREHSDNVAVIGGVDWAFDLSKFSSSDFDAFAAVRAAELGVSKESYKESYYIKTQARIGRGIMLDSHPYSKKNMNWDYFLRNALSEYPVIFGEFGPVFLENAAITEFTDIEKAYLLKTFEYMKEYGISYTAWGMNAWPFLTTSDGMVTPFGEAIKNDIAGIEFDSGRANNLIYAKYGSVRPILQAANGSVYQKNAFYDQAHSEGSKVSSKIAEYIIDADTIKHYDIYPADSNLGIEYTLSDLCAGSKIIISSGLIGYPDKYKVYVSDSQSDLYSNKNLVENMSAEITDSYEIEIDRQVKYIGIIGNGYVRIKELELNGGKIGDFDGDYIITATDIAALRKKLLINIGKNAISDVNSDKTVNIADLVRIKRIAANN